MPLAVAGEAATTLAWLSLMAAAVASAAGARGRRPAGLRWGRRLALVGFACTTVAVLILLAALLGDRFELAYVARNSQRAMPIGYKVAALWSGQAGSLLLWLWLLTAFTAAVAWRRPAEAWEEWPWALAVLAGSAGFYALLVSAVESPFVTALPAPADGRGMNPLLRHPSMLVHPLLLYGGFTAFAVPFAFGMGALMARRLEGAWLAAARRWALVAWLLLSMGLLAGAQWAYEVLGWGGYWGWDPVENAALLPWLTGTAFLHAALAQERRGLLRRWTLLLLCATYLLTVLGTFLTRSGVLASVHAFAESEIGPWFVAYIAAVGAACAYLLADRWPQLADPRPVESAVSREGGLLLQGLILSGTAFTVLWGVLFPLLTRAFGVEVSLGPPYYERLAGPLLLLLVGLMGVGPLLAWRRSAPGRLLGRLWIPALAGLHAAVTVALLRDVRWGAVAGMAAAAFTLVASLAEAARLLAARGRGGWPLRLDEAAVRRLGAYLVHAGVAVMAIGVVGSRFYAVERDLALPLGGRARVGPYVLAATGLHRAEERGAQVVWADVLVWADEDARPDFVMRPERRVYPEHLATVGPVSRVAVAGSWRRDLYVVLAGWEQDGSVLALRVGVYPLVAWIWMGGYLLVLGGLLALWPAGARRTRWAPGTAPDGRRPAEARGPAVASAGAPGPAVDPAPQGAGSRRGGPLGGAVLGCLLLLGLWPAAPAAAGSPGATGPAGRLEVLSELILVAPRQDGVEWLTVVTVANPGPGPVPEVRLPIPRGALAVTLQGGFRPERVRVDDGLVESLPLPPGRRRTYAYLVRLPAGPLPWVFERPVLYPTRQQAVLVDGGRLRLAGEDFADAGEREFGGQRLRAYVREDVAPTPAWRLAVQAAAPVTGLPVVAQGDRPRGWAVPASLVAAALLAGTVLGGRREPWAAALAAAGDAADPEEACARALVTLRRWREAGRLTEEAYGEACRRLEAWRSARATPAGGRGAR